MLPGPCPWPPRGPHTDSSGRGVDNRGFGAPANWGAAAAAVACAPGPIWVFSSMLKTTALMGGFRYKPTTSRILASASGSAVNLKVSARVRLKCMGLPDTMHGCMRNAHPLGQLSRAPVRHSLRGWLERKRHNASALRIGHSGWPPRPGPLHQTGKPLLSKATSNATDLDRRIARQSSHFRACNLVGKQQNGPSSPRQTGGRAAAAMQALKFSPIRCHQFDASSVIGHGVLARTVHGHVNITSVTRH